MALLELIVATGILVVIITGFAAIDWQETRLARMYYSRTVAMEIVDGEIEALAAGEWAAYAKGSHDYKVRADSARNLPPGRFTLTVADKRLKLEWAPTNPAAASRVVREVTLR